MSVQSIQYVSDLLEGRLTERNDRLHRIRALLEVCDVQEEPLQIEKRNLVNRFRNSRVLNCREQCFDVMSSLIQQRTDGSSTTTY